MVFTGNGAIQFYSWTTSAYIKKEWNENTFQTDNICNMML